MRVSELGFSHKQPPTADAALSDRALRLRAGIVSVVVAAGIFAAKFLAYQLTGSTAVLSDALESVVNIVAALFTLVSLGIASLPADENHPYGHGKVEFLSSGFEGGLIAFASLLIVYQAALALWTGQRVEAIEEGLVLVTAAGIANALLGYFLLRTGRRTNSPALEADGQHVLTDFWTSAGVIVGLVLVRVTGNATLDPLVAMVLGANLTWVGAKLLRRAVGGLLDESDPALLGRIADTIGGARTPGVIALHRLRAFRSGGAAHLDAQLVVPRFWPVSQAHEVANGFEESVIAGVGQDADFTLHLEPCRSVYCSGCRVEPCPVRAHAFAQERDWSQAALTGEPPPD